MQSTWENLVEMDMSESGVRPVTLRELGGNGARSRRHARHAARLQPVERHDCAARGSGARSIRAPRVDHIEVTNGTSEANYLLALALLRAGDEVAFEVPNYMQYWRRAARASARRSITSTCASTSDWEPDWDEFERAVTPKTRLVYVSNPNNPTRPRALAGRHAAHRGRAAKQSARTCWPTKSISARRSTARARRASGA